MLMVATGTIPGARSGHRKEDIRDCDVAVMYVTSQAPKNGGCANSYLGLLAFFFDLPHPQAPGVGGRRAPWA